MALNSSGPLSFGGSTTGQSINLELGVSATALASINSTAFRNLAGVASGQISLSNFYGKSNLTYFSSIVYPTNTALFWVNGPPAIDSSGNCYVWARTGDSPQGGALVKLNSTGTIQWARNIAKGAGVSIISPTAITVASSGNIYLLMYVNYAGSYQPVIAKYNTSGTLQWFTNLADDSVYPHSIALDSSENVYVACGGGNSYSEGDGRLIKANSSGVRQWFYNFKVDSTTTGNYGISVDSSGNIYVASRFSASASYKGVVTKFASTPTVTWSKYMGGGSNNYNGSPPQGNSVITDSAGNVYVATSNETSPSVSQTVLLTKYNSSGTQQWSRQILIGRYNLYTGGIQIDSSDNLYICYSENLSAAPFVQAGVAKYNSSGTIQWQRGMYLQSNSAQQTNVMSIYVTNVLAWVISDNSGTSAAQNLVLTTVPLDGTKTGNYTVGSQTLSYFATSYTESAGTVTNATPAATSLTASTPTATAIPYTEASFAMSQRGPTAL